MKKSGHKGLAHHWIEEVTTGKALGVHRYNRALWFAWCGEYEEALAELEAGLQSRPYQMIWTAAEPAFIPLRSNPHFQKVIRGIGLTPLS